jgi:hypothetical protein
MKSIVVWVMVLAVACGTPDLSKAEKVASVAELAGVQAAFVVWLAEILEITLAVSAVPSRFECCSLE